VHREPGGELKRRSFAESASTLGGDAALALVEHHSRGQIKRGKQRRGTMTNCCQKKETAKNKR